MKKSIIYIISMLLPVLASAADVTIVDNKAMTAVEGYAGWFKYTISSLSEGDSFSMIFNNGGWEGGQTADYFVDGARGVMCFTSNGSGSAITEITCPETTVEESMLTEGNLSIYSKGGCIYGNVEGTVEIYNMSGNAMQVIDAEGVFSSRQLPTGFYIVRSGAQEAKILVM